MDRALINHFLIYGQIIDRTRLFEWMESHNGPMEWFEFVNKTLECECTEHICLFCSEIGKVLDKDWYIGSYCAIYGMTEPLYYIALKHEHFSEIEQDHVHTVNIESCRVPEVIIPDAIQSLIRRLSGKDPHLKIMVISSSGY